VKFRNAIPILYCEDVLVSLRYYVETLGFENRWDWGDPPSFGGVSKDGVELFFCKEGQGNPGTWLSLFVDNVDEYFDFIKSKGATIISPPQTMEWGIREMLVGDPDGHRIRFGQPASLRKPGASDLPESISIKPRLPSEKEYLDLLSAVGGHLLLCERRHGQTSLAVQAGGDSFDEGDQ
jgi:catechol 2,3-dioxygenase-like lactoylglutathione lyase family enzyme